MSTERKRRFDKARRYDNASKFKIRLSHKVDGKSRSLSKGSKESRDLSIPKHLKHAQKLAELFDE